MHFDLPRYPWQRQRLHDELPEHAQTKFGTPDTYSMLGDPDLHARFAWELQLNRQALPWLADHVVDGLCVLPGAAYLDAALSAASLRTGLNSVTAEDIRFVAPLIVDPADGTILRTELDESSRRFTIRSRGTTSTFWTVHATGRLVEATYLATKHPLPDTRDMSEIDPADFYAGFAARGLDYGHHFQRVTSLRVDSMAVIATVEALSEPDTTRHLVHPCLIDAALQTVAPLVEQSIGRHHGTLVPIAVDAVRAFAPLPDQVTVVARRHPTDPLCADYVILDSEHTACMQLMDVRLGPIVPGKEPIDRLAPLFYEEVWDLRDQLSTTVPPTSQQTATLVVALGDKPHVRARQLSEALPHSGYHDCIRTAELEADLTQRLSEVAGTLPRLHVCLVVGDIADDFAALCVLKRIAVTIEKFLDEQLGDRAAEMSPFGDDTFYVSLITERAFVHPNDASVPNTSHAALAGARRVLLGEQPRLRWRLIDTDEATEIPDLSAELAVPGAFCHDRADEVLLRSGLRWTPIVTQTLPQRLEAMARDEQFAEPEANFTVEAPKSRLLADLGWRRCPRRSPGRGEVELQMEAVGLNYKDAVKALGLLGERELEQTHFRTHLGMEGVGVVSHVGPEVAELQIGDVVATAAQGMLTRYHIADAALCFKLPNPGGRQAVRPEHCASITAFVTAEHSLLTLSRLQPGETVLIQGAAGGVGSAAIQVAKLCGARVIGTASTDQRRCYALAAGADHMIDSRSLNFVDDVRELTNGHGADVIISTAPGEILRHNFDAVAEFGRIVEVGKADIYGGGILDMAVFDKNVSYFSVDMDRMLAKRTDDFLKLTAGIFDKFSSGIYQPLPVEAFPTADLARAFDDVFRSERTGRVAVRLTDDAPPVKPAWRDITIDPEGTYLITGGYGGFGLATGRWLASRGARHLVLVGRRGATTGFARRHLDRWRASGVEVTDEAVDVTDAVAVAALVKRSHTTEHPLRGIFHTAAAVADQRVSDLELDVLKRVYEAKVQGARALWSAVTAANLTLDQFVFYSSGGSMLGLFGQYNYTAANLALQALTETIVRRGQPAICIGWGHMSGSGGGMAADETTAKYLDTLGFDSIDMDDGPVYLQEALRLGVTQAAIMPINWSKLSGAAGHLRHVLRTSALICDAAEANSDEERLRAALVALDDGKRAEVVAYMLAEQLAVVMGVPAESIEIDIPVTELGLDSLMAVEFGVRTTQALGVQLNTLSLGRSFDLRQAGARIAEMMASGKGIAA